MNPECSKEEKRISLQVLQPAAGDKEILVGGSRQSVGAKLGDKGKRNNTVNEKFIQHSTVKGNSKKMKVVNELTQRDSTEGTAGDKENFVGGSEQSVTIKKVGVKVGYKDKRNNTVNKKFIQQSTVKGNSKKSKVVNELTQTDTTENKTQININALIADLTSEGEPSSVDYWRILAERRRIALEETLQENKTLQEVVQFLKEDKELTDQMLEETRLLVEDLKEMGDEPRDDSEDESSS